MTSTEEEVRDVAENAEENGPDEVEPEESRLVRLRDKLWTSRSRRTRIGAAILVVLLVVGGIGTAWLHSGRSVFGVHAGEGPLSFLPEWLPEGVAFQYGDQAITVEALDKHAEMLKALYGVQPPKGSKMDNFRRDVAKSYAVSLILDQAAADRGIKVADKQARDTLSRFVGERLGSGPDAYSQFIGSLADTGTSEQTVLDELKRRLAMTQLFEKETADIKDASDADVQKAFAERKNELATPERRQLSNIVVETKADAEQVAAALQKGKSFASEAKSNSLDGSTRDKGGDIGTIGRADLEPEYGKAAFGADKGDVFGPVKTQHGWNVGKVDKVVPGQPAEFEKIKKDLKDQLRTEATVSQWRGWLGDAIADADVRYADEYRPADPDAPPEESPADPSQQVPGQGPR